jgi:hypothetical protein
MGSPIARHLPGDIHSSFPLESPMSDVDFSQKFPNMRPIRSAPSLQTINGVGLSIYGRRDYDAETGTYVKTQCFCVLFIPVIAIAAYRVADAQQGWYFIGKVPLSPLAKVWNCLLLSFIVGLIGRHFWLERVHSPEYVAGQQLVEADRLAEAGQQGKAAALYRDVMAGNTSHAAPARSKFVQLLDALPATPDDTAAVLHVAVDWQQQTKQTLVPNLFERGMDYAKQHTEDQPKGALAVLDVIAPLAPDAEACNAQRRALLERLVAQSPDDPDLASRLAVLYELQGDMAKCESLLAAHANRLGILEGARILGRIYAAQGKHEPAYALLKPYTEGRLAKLHAAEQAYEKAVDAAENRAIEQLKTGKAPGFNFQRHKTANDAAKNAMVREYVVGMVKDDPAIKSAQQQLIKEAPVVPVALDLAIVMLHRAQGLADPAARRKELEQAEQTFLAIRGLAGETEKYRLYLGQVYFWLGKQGEGRKLFDELLQAKNRDFDILLATAQVYREVGAVSDARALLEEAYKAQTDAAKKQAAALFRSLLFVDLDDEIAWLTKSNQEDASVRASLSAARGNKAIWEGRDEEAAGHLRQAVDTYLKMAENASMLNNCALAYLSLFHATRDREHLTRGIEMLDKAVALKPDDSILLHNAATTLWQTAFDDIIGNAVDLKALKRRGGLDLLSFLAADPAAKQQWVERVRKHPGLARARGYLEKLLILAPKRADSYAILAELFEFTRDQNGLVALQQRLEKADLDMADARREMLDFYAGKNDQKHLTDLQNALTRLEAVLPAARKAGGATRAVAAVALARQKLALAMLTPSIKLDEIVALADEAHAAAPSEATHSLRVSVLCQRAHQALIKQDPAYAALAAKTDRVLGGIYLLAIIQGREGKLRDLALANADLKLALKRSIEYGQRFPQARGSWHWALLRAAHADEAKKIAQAAQQDQVLLLKNAIDAQLSPLSGSSAVHSYWMRQLAGKEVEAAEVLKQFVDRGVPLPPEIR